MADSFNFIGQLEAANDDAELLEGLMHETESDAVSIVRNAKNHYETAMNFVCNYSRMSVQEFDNLYEAKLYDEIYNYFEQNFLRQQPEQWRDQGMREFLRIMELTFLDKPGHLTEFQAKMPAAIQQLIHSDVAEALGEEAPMDRMPESTPVATVAEPSSQANPTTPTAEADRPERAAA